MAGANRGSARGGQYRRTEGRQTMTYVDGTAVRRLEAAPERRSQQSARRNETSAATRKNRERALQMNLRYVLFLTAAAVVTVMMCVNYLQLQAQNTKLRRDVTVLATTLDEAVLENDSNYNRIMANVDMAHVQDVAMNELGMVYAAPSQIIEYTLDDQDYVRQYSEVPAE